MGLRQRERIHRGSPDTQQCDACETSQFEHDITRKKVAGRYVELCTTCSMEARSDRLLHHLVAIASVRDEDVNQELMDALANEHRSESGRNTGI